MPRNPDIVRPVRLHTTLPEDLRAKLDLYLFSNVEGRVPNGAYRRFIEERIVEFFSRSQLEIGKYTGATEELVFGSPEVIEHLKQYLEATHDSQS